MFTQTLDHQADPIVEILRLAYRRGLALRQAQDVTLRQEQAEKSQAVNVIPLAGETLTAERLTPQRKANHERLYPPAHEQT